MSLYPQIGQGSLNTASGIANRIKDLERKVASVKAGSGYIGDGAIKGSKIKSGAITTSHIQAGSITSDLITTGAINAGHIQAGAITATQIAAGTITATQIAASTITAAQIATGTITAVQIAANTITTSQIAADTILAGNIAASAITASELAANSVTSSHIQAGTIIAADIAASTITATQIAAGTITGGLIAGGTITATNIATGTITGSLLAAATITGDNLVVDTITSREVVGTTLSGLFADLGTVTAGTLRIGVAGGQKVAIGDTISTSAGTKSGIVATDTSNNITFWADPATGNLQIKGQLLTGSTGLGALAAGGGTIDGTSNIASATIAGDRLVANTITAAKIAVGTLTANEIAAATITGAKIAAATITGTNIAAGTITADKITVQLSGTNRMRNSNALLGLAPGSITDSWYGPHGTSHSIVFVHDDYQSGRAIYGGNPISNGSNPHIYTPYVHCRGWTTLSAAITMHAAASTARRIGIQFFDSTLTLTSSLYYDSAAVNGWYRNKVEGVAVPWGSSYVRFYAQVLSSQTGDELHWTAAKIEEGEKATSWSPAPEDIGANEVGTTQISPGAITTGLLAATAIDGMTITGATIRTASSGERLELTTAGGLKKFDASGNTPVILGPADGLKLMASTLSSPPNDRRIQWLSGANPTAEVFTANMGGGGGIDGDFTLRSKQNPGSTGANRLLLEAANSAGAIKAALHVYFAPSSGYGWVQALAGAETRTILNSAGESSFLQLSGPALRKANFGQTNVTFGGTPASATVAVNHGLGATPSYVFATCSTGHVVFGVTSNYTSTQFTLQGRTDGGNLNTTVGLNWMAVL